MSDNRQKPRAEIIIAIIGLVGVIGAALLTNWDKVFPPNNDSPSDNIPSKLAAPIPFTPACSKTINSPPDNDFLILGWEPISAASTYSVEIDCFGCSEYGRKWHSLASGTPWHIRTGLGLRSPIYSSKIHAKMKERNGLALRWRVWAVDHDGIQGKKSSWCKLSFAGD